ncbi:MAG: tetratricopeptide repeat protein [Elusimicrobiota bacterium]|jgi:tetratricopeptide (TPR) repeat protein
MLPSSRLLLLALAGLAPFPLRADEPATSPAPSATAPAPLPDKIVRFEQMLVRSPGPGRAFDEVFAHYFSNEGLASLRQRWTAARDAAPAGPAAAVYGLLLGQLAERIGDTATARARYTEAAASAPADYRPLQRLGRLEIRDGKLPAGIAALEKAATLDMGPADAQDVLRDLARARSRAFDETGALAAWKTLATRFPDDALVLEEVGQALLDAAAYDEAAATFTALEKASAGDAYRAVLARLRLGEVASKKGDREAALARFSAALDGTHRDSWLHREAETRVDALFREKGDFDGLIAFREGRLQGTSRDPIAARRLAELLIELNRTDKALEWFGRATGWSPDDYPLRFAYIRALIAANRGDDALPRLQELVKLQPKESSYREALGQLHWNRAKAAAGPAAASERALALDTWAALAPGRAPVADLLALAEIYRTHALDEETRATLARALATEPASYDLRERLALQLLAMKRDDEAWTIARGGKSGLADAGQYRRLASLEKRNNLLAEALVSVDRGLALAPAGYELLDLRWQVLAGLERWDDAIALLPKLLAQSPGDFAVETIETRHVQALRSAGKLEAALAALSKRVAAEDPSLTEADYRLNIRLVLAQTVPADADAAFAAARKRFPNSFSVAQLEADYRDRSATLADRVAAIRRLLALRPERSPEWLRRLVNIYRYEGDFDGARRSVGELVALAPADAQNHVLSADLEFDAGATAAGIASLQRALRLASDPAPVRARLARAWLEQGRPAAALEIYEEAFYSAADENARRSVLAPLTDAAVQAGDLDGLLTRFADRNRPRRDTADYYVELGEIYFNASNYARAGEAWNRALDLNRNDQRLLARLVELARRSGDSAEVARLVRLRHELDPSAANATELGEALLEADSGPEALELFLAHPESFYTDTTLLPRILPALAARDLAAPLIERLRSQASSVVDPADRDFVLATAFITIRDFPRAEQLLWDVYNRPPAPVVAAPATPLDPNAPPPPPVQPQMLAWQTIQTARQGYQTAVQLLQNQSSGRGYYRGGRSYISYGNQPLPPSPTKTQDTALGYLGALAVQQDKAAEFLKRLSSELETRHVPASQRLLEFAKVQARDAALAQLDAALAEPSPSLPALSIAQNLLPEPGDPYTGQRPDPTPELEARIKALNDTLAKFGPPLSPFRQRMKELSELQQKKDYDGALALLAAFKATDNLSANDRAQLAYTALQLRIQAKRWDGFLPVLRDGIANEPMFFGDGASHFFGAYLARDEGETPPTEADMDAIASLLLDVYAKPVPASAMAQQQSMRRMTGSSAGRQNIDMLLNSGASVGGSIPGQEYQLQQFVQQLGKNTEAFLARVLAAGEKRDAESLRLARTFVLRIALSSAHTKLAESVGTELLKTNPEPGLTFNLAELAYRDNRHDVAKTRYEAVPASSGQLALAAQARLLELALLKDDTEAAKAAATRLVQMKPPSYLPNLDLAGALRDLGLDKTLKLPASSGRSSSRNNRFEEINRVSNELNTALNKKDKDGAETLARRLLAMAPLSEARKGNDWGRRNALEAYVKTGLMEAYLADLDTQLAASPGSSLVIELLAEAHGAIRQQASNTGNRPLATVATSSAALALPLRLRLSRKGDIITASYKLLPSPTPPPPSVAGSASDPTPSPPPPVPVWLELGSVSLDALGQPLPGLTGRNQNFQKLSDALFSDARLGDRDLAPAAFTKRDTLRLDGQSATIHLFDAPLGEGSSVEVTLAAAATPNVRVPASRGLLLRDANDNHPRAALLLADDGSLSFTARRYTGLRELDYLAKLVALRPRDEQLRTRYLESLFSQNRVDDAVAFVNRPENQDLLPRFASNSKVIEFHRKSGGLPAFVVLVADRAVANANRPGQYPQIDYQVLEFARRLREAKDIDVAIIVWEKMLPALRDQQASQVRGELARALLALKTPEARARALVVIRDLFVPPPAPAEKTSPIFRDSQNRYGQNPWYAGGWNTSGIHFIAPPLTLLDTLDDPALIRTLIEENVPRAAAPDADWGPLCYDLALKLRTGDPAAIPAFVSLWNDSLSADKNPGDGRKGRRSQPGPINGFLPACLDRLATWPDPDRRIETVFRSVIDQLPQNRAYSRMQFGGGGPLSVFAQNPWLASLFRFIWSDYLQAHGDTAGYRQSLLDAAQSLARQDTRQINSSVVTQLFGRLLANGDIAEARNVYETTLRRAQSRQGGRGNDTRARHYAAMLDALEGKGDAPAPALSAWVAPADDGAPELRWEITGRLKTDKDNRDNNPIPPVFGQALPIATAGAYDLVVEFAASEKGEALSRLELPSVAARGRQRLDNPPASGLFRASLRPKAGGADIVLPPQVFSAQPNLLANPEARITPATTAGAPMRTPGWSLPLPAFTCAGGPSVDGTVTRFAVPQNDGGNTARLTRSAPVPIDPKGSYLITAWASQFPEEYGEFGLEFLDANGQVLSNSISRGLSHNELRWQRIVFSLCSSSRRNLPDRNGIPADAVAVRLWIGGQSGLRLSDLALQSLPEPAAPQPPPAK